VAAEGYCPSKCGCSSGHSDDDVDDFPKLDDSEVAGAAGGIAVAVLMMVTTLVYVYLWSVRKSFFPLCFDDDVQAQPLVQPGEFDDAPAPSTAAKGCTSKRGLELLWEPDNVGTFLLLLAVLFGSIGICLPGVFVTKPDVLDFMVAHHEVGWKCGLWNAQQTTTETVTFATCSLASFGDDDATSHFFDARIVSSFAILFTFLAFLTSFGCVSCCVSAKSGCSLSPTWRWSRRHGVKPTALDRSRESTLHAALATCFWIATFSLLASVYGRMSADLRKYLQYGPSWNLFLVTAVCTFCAALCKVVSRTGTDDTVEVVSAGSVAGGSMTGSFDCCIDCCSFNGAGNGAGAIRIVGSNEPLSIAASPVHVQSQPGGPGGALHSAPCSACGAKTKVGSPFCQACGHSQRSSSPPPPALPEPLLVDGKINPQRVASCGLGDSIAVPEPAAVVMPGAPFCGCGLQLPSAATMFCPACGCSQ